MSDDKCPHCIDTLHECCYCERKRLTRERDAAMRQVDRLRSGLWVESDLGFGDDRDRMMAEIYRLRLGIEAYRDCPHGLPAHRGCQCDMCAWERDDRQRREVSDSAR